MRTRPVVLVLHHDDDGAQGLVLNRPVDADIDAVLPGWEAHASSPAKVFQGGPVQLDSALGLAVVPGDAPAPSGVRRLFGSVALVDLDAQPSLVVPAVAGLRIFAGYAGWSPGQLEDEIRTGSWFVVDSESGDVFTDEPAGLWQRVLRRQGDPLRWVAWYPRDPSLN